VLAAEVVPAVAPAEALHDALEPLVDIRGGAIGSDGEHGEKFLRLDPLLLPAMLSGVERALHVGQDVVPGVGLTALVLRGLGSGRRISVGP
jgi:hypothetical protein